MPVSPAVRRTIALACAVVVLVALVGAFVYASGDVGSKGGGSDPTAQGLAVPLVDCGSGFEAASTKIPSPLLTPQENELARVNKNAAAVGVAKAKPYEECREAGASRLIKAGVGAGLVLLPIGALLGFLYWPRREELVIDLADDAGPSRPFTPRSGGYTPTPRDGGYTPTPRGGEAPTPTSDTSEEETEEQPTSRGGGDAWGDWRSR